MSNVYKINLNNWEYLLAMAADIADGSENDPNYRLILKIAKYMADAGIDMENINVTIEDLPALVSMPRELKKHACWLCVDAVDEYRYVDNHYGVKLTEQTRFWGQMFYLATFGETKEEREAQF